MLRTKKTLLIAAVLAVLGIAGSAMQKAQPAASTPAPVSIPVSISAPLPVPISGTVSAQQSGTWNVGINGTPTVNVANPATAPVLTVNANDVGRTPYQAVLTNPTCGASFCNASFNVPSGHRLVVQHVSGLVWYSQSPALVSMNLVSTANSTAPLSSFAVPVNLNPATAPYSSFDQPVLVFYDAGQQGLAELGWPSSTGATVSLASFTVTGYLVDCTIAPCAAIAS